VYVRSAPLAMANKDRKREMIIERLKVLLIPSPSGRGLGRGPIR
jgi:hypothetical protein